MYDNCNRYNLLLNEVEFNKFVNLLPDLKENECYFIILIARKKWNPSADMPNAVKLKREVAFKKDDIKRIIQQWEVPLGYYKTPGGVPIPEENLAVYISPNPKNQKKGVYELIEQLVKTLKDDKPNINIKGMANDAIQISNGSKNFIDFDIDIAEGDDLYSILGFIDEKLGVTHEDSPILIKTSGGAHYLIPHSVFSRSSKWHPEIKNHTFKSEIEVKSNDLSPTPGCRQGRVSPYII